jgi:hypothetical protein
MLTSALEAALFFLDRNAAFSDFDLNAGGFLVLLIITVAKQARDNGKSADNQKEKITVDHVLILFPRIVPRLDAGTHQRGVNARTRDFVPTHGPGEA